MPNPLKTAFGELESRFQGIVSNVPGLVFQFSLDVVGQITFIYLSDACKALLGILPEELKHKPALFTEIMVAEDRIRFQAQLESCAKDHKTINWEGQIWIEEWEDYKWINLRASPGKDSNGNIQWTGIITNITQSKKEKQEIEVSRRRLAELTAYMEQIKEKERVRIAREIHDDLGSNLTAIKIGLDSILKKLKSGHKVLAERIKDLETIVDTAFEAAHRISSDLRPNVLELGIVAALQWQTNKFKDQTSIPCTFNVNQPEINISTDQEIALFRICQEAMSNIAKHARANQVEIMLSVDNGQVSLHINDDGVGIKPGDELKNNSFGLRGMQERVVALGGSFSIRRGDLKGTQLLVKLPLAESPAK
jgi:two-component system, NarL family, sensor histidine kinase UhpB